MNLKQSDMKFGYMIFGVIALLVLLAPDLAFASNAQTSNTAWDTPLQVLRDAFTGPIAFTISLLAIIIGGAMLAMGGEMNEFARRMIMVILAVALIVFANNFLTQFFAGGAQVILLDPSSTAQSATK